MTTPARIVFATFGGIRAVGRLLDLDHSSVRRWDQPKAERGSGGLIPAEHHRPLLRAAKRQGLALTPDDLVLGRVAHRRRAR